MLPRTVTAAIIPLALLATTAPAQVRLIGIDSQAAGNTLYEIDPTMGTLTALGPVTGVSGAIGALAYDSAGDVLYLSSTTNAALYRLDHSTFVATLIGNYNAGGQVFMHGLEYVQSTGRLYGGSTVAAGGADFFEIDKASGQTSPIGLMGMGGFGSLAFVNGTMLASDLSQDRLRRVNLTSAMTTLVGSFGAGTNIGVAFAFDPGHGLIASDNLGDALYRVNPNTGAATLIATHMPVNIISLAFVRAGSVGTRYCAAAANSTGVPGELWASGSSVVLDNDVTLNAEQLPTNAFGYFLTSLTQGFVANPGGSEGNLCLGGSIGRYVGAGQVQSSGASGRFTLQLDLTRTPTPLGLVPIAMGETWNFQTWHRDAIAGSATSNLTNGLSVSFN